MRIIEWCFFQFYISKISFQVFWVIVFESERCVDEKLIYPSFEDFRGHSNLILLWIKNLLFFFKIENRSLVQCIKTLNLPKPLESVNNNIPAKFSLYVLWLICLLLYFFFKSSIKFLIPIISRNSFWDRSNSFINPEFSKALFKDVKSTCDVISCFPGLRYGLLLIVWLS